MSCLLFAVVFAIWPPAPLDSLEIYAAGPIKTPITIIMTIITIIIIRILVG